MKTEKPTNLILIPIPLLEFNPLFVIASHTFSSFICAFFVKLLGLTRKFDMIYIRTSPLAFGFITSKSSRKITVVKIPSITEDELRGKTLSLEFAKKMSHFLDRVAILKSKRVAVLNPLMGKQLTQKRFAKPEKPWLILPAGVDLELIAAVKHSHKIFGEICTPKIGFLGSLVWWQGVDVTAKAMGILKKDNLNVQLLIVGDGEEKQKIVEICKQLMVDYEITGFLPHKKALEHLSTFDIMVLPRIKSKTTECVIPIKLVEAFALGVPVIVTPHEALLDLYTDHVDVVYAEPSPEDVASKMALLLSNPELRRILSLNGKLNAVYFDYSAITETLLKSLVVN